MKNRQTKWSRRDKKRRKRKHGMRVHGKTMLQIENAREFKVTNELK